jgi:hypothetical protein
MTPESATRLRELLNSERLNRTHVQEAMRLGGIVGEMPASDGQHDGIDFWTTANFARWANTQGIHVRATLPQRDLAAAQDGVHYRGKVQG